MSDEIDVNRLLVEACDSTQTGTHLEEIFTLTISAKVPYWAEEHLLASLARNPNTPPEILEWLAIRYAYQVLQNPAVPLLLIEDPLWPQSSAAREQMAKFEACPEIIRRHTHGDLLFDSRISRILLRAGEGMDSATFLHMVAKGRKP